MARAIAVVEDDESIREMLRYYFQSVGYAVRAYESGEALFAGEEGQSLPALYILDIMLPGMDGLEILRRLREGRDTADVPVIMLTARTAEMDRVAGLENGADDYVVKPFGIMELQARVKAVLRRTERRSDRLLTWGDLEIDPAAREVRKAGRVVELTYKEFELLKLLCTRRGVALTRDEILQAVWDYDYTGVSHGHYYEGNFRGAKQDFAVRSGLISRAQLFTEEELTELYRATDYLLEEGPEPNSDQLKAIQTARTKIEYTVPDLQSWLEQIQSQEPQMNL